MKKGKNKKKATETEKEPETVSLRTFRKWEFHAEFDVKTADDSDLINAAICKPCSQGSCQS